MLTRHGAWVRLEMQLPETAYPPIGFDAGDGNLRRVVGNAPTNATDPSGLQPPKQDEKPDPKPESAEFKATTVQFLRVPNSEFVERALKDDKGARVMYKRLTGPFGIKLADPTVRKAELASDASGLSTTMS